MTDFSDSNTVKKWFRRNSPDAAVLLATRAVLRALPAFEMPESRDLPIYRALATTWVAVRYPSKRDAIKDSLNQAVARACAIAAVHAGEITTDADALSIPEHIQAAETAYPDPHAAAIAMESAIGSAGHMLSYNTKGLLACAVARASYTSLATDWEATATEADAGAQNAAIYYAIDAPKLKLDRADEETTSPANRIAGEDVARAMNAAFAADAEAIETGSVTVSELAGRPLWSLGTPTWAEGLGKALSESPEWDTWGQWYTDRLNGNDAGEESELARTTLSANLWDDGPSSANSQLKKLLATIRAKGEAQGPASAPLENPLSRFLRDYPLPDLTEPELTQFQNAPEAVLVAARRAYSNEYDESFKENTDSVTTSQARERATQDAERAALTMLQDWYKEYERQVAEKDWRTLLAALESTKIGARWIESRGTFVIDPAGEGTDKAVALEPITKQLHEAVSIKAAAFAGIAKRLDNAVSGWTGIGPASNRFEAATHVSTEAIPERIGMIYSSILELGSFLELNIRLLRTPDPAIVPLDPDVHRALSDLIRTAAPWLRLFPSARELDNEAGAFLTRSELFAPALEAIEIARIKNLISDPDASAVAGLIAAGHRGEVLGTKASTRGVHSVRNLIYASAGAVALFLTDSLSSNFSNKSVLVDRAGSFLASAEAHVLELASDLPDDVRVAIRKLLDELQQK